MSSFRPRMKILAACVGVALAQLGTTGTARADSAVGVDTALGNALNPPGRSAMPRPLDNEGYDTVRRSPSGQLYGIPYQTPDEVTKTESGWEYSGGIEAGLLGGDGDKKNSKFREYKDLKNGGYLNYFEVEAEKPETARFIQAFGGSAGRKDQFYGVQFGRYNDWKVRLFYNETPHVFSDTFKRIYTSNGNNNLVLNSALVNPGGGGANAIWTLPNLSAAAKALPDTEVGLVRKKGGFRYDANLSDRWKAYASISEEKRKGERPFGFMGTEGVEPIDYSTTDLLAGIQYADSLTAFNLRLSGSLFANDIETLYARSPLVAAANGPVGTLANLSTLVYSLPPDNQAYNIKAEVSRKLPDFYNGRLAATVAWNSSRQNDSIRMPIDPGLMTNGAVISGATTAASWNGTNGCPLTRCNSGLRVDSMLYNLSLSFNPLDDLNVKGTYRRYQTDNKSGTYYSYNPLTGTTPLNSIWFSGLDNTAIAFTTQVVNAPGVTTMAASRDLFSRPRENTQSNYTLSADYALGHSQNLEGTLEREDFSHTYRERDKTWEDKIKLTYVNRALGDTTLRTSYEYDRKRGSFYDPLVTTRGYQNWFAVYGVAYSRAALQDMINHAGTGNYPTLAFIQNWILGGNGTGGNFNSGGFMKPDQADRDQNILNARLNYMAREDLDIGASLQLKRMTYPNNPMGVQKDNLNSYNVDLNYQPATSTQFSAFYSRQDGQQRQIENYGTDANGVAWTAASLPAYLSQPSVCGPLSAANIDCWLNNQRLSSSNITVDTKNTNNVIGFGVSHDFGAIKFSANYTYSYAKTKITHAYGGSALTAANKTVEATYGDYPDIVTTQNMLDLNLIVPVNKQASVRFLYRYEDMKLKDWHYDFYGASSAGTAFAPADYGPQKFNAQVFGVFLQYKL